MATTLEIIQGINQAAANAYDGAHDERFVTGEPKKIGLSREEGCPIIDSRVSDGFGIKIIGDMLQINYEANVRLSDVYAVGFEEECEIKVEAIAAFLKKEYKLLTGKMLKLTAQGEINCFVQNTSRVRTFVMCHKLYKIGGMKDVETLGEGNISSMDAKYQKFLKEGSFADEKKTYNMRHREETGDSDLEDHYGPSDPSPTGKERAGAHSTTDATDERIKREKSRRRLEALEHLVKNMDLSDDDRDFFMDMKQKIESGIAPDYFETQQASSILYHLNRHPAWKLFE